MAQTKYGWPDELAAAVEAWDRALADFNAMSGVLHPDPGERWAVARAVDCAVAEITATECRLVLTLHEPPGRPSPTKVWPLGSVVLAGLRQAGQGLVALFACTLRLLWSRPTQTPPSAPGDHPHRHRAA